MRSSPAISSVRFTLSSELDRHAGVFGTVSLVLGGLLRIDGLRLRRGRGGWLVLDPPAGQRVRVVDDHLWAHVQEHVVAELARRGELP
jgi:hypothetical protein